MRTAIVIGNGLTISQQQHLQCALNPSSPFGWPVPKPGESEVLLMERLPHLLSYLKEQNSDGARSDFDVMNGLVANLTGAPVPAGLTDDEQNVLLDTCHFLAVGYGWFQNQVDSCSVKYDEWAWDRWLKAKSDDLVGVLSWNYDLTAERLLERAGRPFFYPGFHSMGFDPQGLNWQLPAVPVCKPHGSTNFSHLKRAGVSAVLKGGNKEVMMDYPRPFSLFGLDGTMDALPRNELQTIRTTADVVLPGEQNRFEQILQWVGNAIDSYARAIVRAEHLLIVGFSMAECDRDEFRRAIAPAIDLQRITIANPNLSDEMVDELRGQAPELIHWPDGPDGPELEL